jgi:hypothetical protein
VREENKDRMQSRRGHRHGEPVRRRADSRRGATWASSEVVITADGTLSRDRGWNDAGEQVWGAEGSGYRFVREPAAGPSAASP